MGCENKWGCYWYCFEKSGRGKIQIFTAHILCWGGICSIWEAYLSWGKQEFLRKRPSFSVLRKSLAALLLCQSNQQVWVPTNTLNRQTDFLGPDLIFRQSWTGRRSFIQWYVTQTSTCFRNKIHRVHLTRRGFSAHGSPKNLTLSVDNRGERQAINILSRGLLRIPLPDVVFLLVAQSSETKDCCNWLALNPKMNHVRA